MNPPWPTVEMLRSMYFDDLEEALVAIASLPPEDEDRKLFLFAHSDLTEWG